MNQRTIVIYEVTDIYQIDVIHAYANGSGFKGTMNADAIIQYPTLHTEHYPHIHGPCGALCSNYTAEIKKV